MKTIEIYVNYPEKELNFSTITEAFQYLATDYQEHEASFPAIHEDVIPATIYIAPGIYREKLVLTRPYTTLVGASTENTIFVYGDYAYDEMEDGSKRGTFRTATLRIFTHDVTLKNITLQNDAGFGHRVGQALALYVDGDRISFFDCALLGSQDTLFTAPLPITEAKPGGFTGPGEKKPRT